MGLFDFFQGKSSSNQSSLDLSDLKFISDDHIRYQNGKDVSGHNKDCWRGIRIQDNIQGGQGYTVTMYNLDGNHPVWGNNIQMAPKRMKIISQNSSSVSLRGYGTDATGASFADYGITLNLANNTVEKVTLHMYDRGIEIIYFKALKPKSQPLNVEKNDFDSFKRFVSAWHKDMSANEKFQIAIKTDALNNMGATAYNDDDVDEAIKFFEQALLVMPNNDDALKNLLLCYSEQGMHSKAAEMKKKLDYLQNPS
jgi:tetratricopeptide (TPR) repeat protein